MSKLRDIYHTALPEKLPQQFRIFLGDKELVYEKRQSLRYGVNPHQQAALYSPAGKKAVMGNLKELKTGKQGLSQTNVEDMDRALNILKYFDAPACAVMKHLNPTGVAVARKNDTLREVYLRARDSDSQAAFGSIVGFNCPVDGDTAGEIVSTFVEGVVAPRYEQGAVEKFGEKRNMRVVQIANLDCLPKFAGGETGYLCLSVLGDGSIVVSDPYTTKIRRKDDLQPVTRRTPTEREFEDMLFAWYVCANVRSNGIVLAKDGCTVSVGAGQQDRVTAVKIAVDKALKWHAESLRGSVLASDGFLPFRDSIDLIAKYDVSAVIQPGGSVRDQEVVDACDQYGIAMVFTGERCFAHF
ncbi:hypothetical protein [Candidatus Hecatella orcuttiae]|jgi:phosphoribosylaminoimidazolecarboxamide formyltransferase/IMP cyclohydrolase|uniref:hypothetical protein n=1 Tax=Candidatus Hecatella orcuttiae TaxID=1935119 RepID=UPI002867EBFD|nr:hypothetical protein [Candidatus Hecatella orcuttiae]